MKMKKFICLTLALAMMTTPVLAADNYAYSIGINDSTGLFSSDDFTVNVNYASNVFGLIPRITSSYKNTSPSISYLRGDNPSSNPRLGSSIVFINGHGNYDNIAFDDYSTGVYYKNDMTSSNTGISYAGVLDIDMSNTELINFAGCSTGSGTTNLASNARKQGATAAIGYTNSINTRNTDGPQWLQKFHDNLVNGGSISGASSYATAIYPKSNLSTYMKVYGSDSTTVRANNKLNIQLKDFDVNLVDVPLAEYESELFEVIEIIKQVDDTFNIDDYKLTVNIHTDEGKNGLIKIVYYIDGDIETNKAFVAEINNNRVVDILYSIDEIQKISQGNSRSISNIVNIENTDEQALLDIVSTHKTVESRVRSVAPITEEGDKVLENRDGYYYDYVTEELSYTNTTFIEKAELGGAIVDVTEETILN